MTLAFLDISLDTSKKCWIRYFTFAYFVVWFLLNKKENWKDERVDWKCLENINFILLFTNSMCHIVVVLLRNWDCMNEIFMIWRPRCMVQRNRKCIFYLVQDSRRVAAISFFILPYNIDFHDLLKKVEIAVPYLNRLFHKFCTESVCI